MGPLRNRCEICEAVVPYFMQFFCESVRHELRSILGYFHMSGEVWLY